MSHELSLQQCIDESKKLAAKVRAAGYVPDLVVGIREGGILPAHVVATEFGARLATIGARRPASSFKHSLPGRVAAWALSSIYRRSYAFRSFTELFNRGRGRSVDVPTDCTLREGERRILLVDDFSSSGNTFLVAAGTLRGARTDVEIRSAALTVLPGRTGAAFEPEYSLSNEWLSFPWSTDSTEYAAYQGWKRERAIPGI